MITSKKQNERIIFPVNVKRQSSAKFPRDLQAELSNIVKSDEPKIKTKKQQSNAKFPRDSQAKLSNIVKSDEPKIKTKKRLIKK
jgi:hypothetical protein